MANPRLHLWAVDPFMVAFTEKTTRYFLRQFIKEGRCEVIPKYTPAAAEQLAHLKDRLDYVFIDGGHAYENVLEDIACWQPLVRPGGILCGHDYAMEQDGSGWNGVARAVREKLPGHYQPVPNMFAWIKP
jgi:predicted O-methyltransferase YrrM